MRTVVIFASEFSPASLPSSIRPRLFANHLAEFGWKPIIIATRPEFYDCPLDPDNEELIEPHVEVIRTKAIPVAFARRLGFGDIGIRTLREHWNALREVVASRQVDLLLISVPPCVPMLLGRLARRVFGIPYVLDYQDPWVTDAWWKIPRAQRPPKWPLAWAVARFLEPVAVRGAAALTGVSLGATDYAATLNKGIPRTEIPFGAEPDEFRFLRSQPRNNPIFDPADGLLHLVYTGVVIAGMYPALRVLFQGLRSLLEAQPGLAARLRVHFVGTSYAMRGALPQVLPMAAEAGVGEIVTERVERVSYLDALRILLDSTGLFILGTGEPHYTPSKIFPYALAGKPLLAILHEASPAPELLRGITGTTSVTFGHAGPDSRLVPELYLRLRAMLTAGPAREPDEERLAPFTARAMTQRLAAVFDRVVAV